jgi:hypothetical protein
MWAFLQPYHATPSGEIPVLRSFHRFEIDGKRKQCQQVAALFSEAIS